MTGRRTDSRNWVLLNCIVGVNRIAINRGDVIWNGNFDALHDVKIARTFMVRYIVLTASSSGALRNVHH
ncbi:phosphoenolpyruvate protein kinase [Rhodopirellula bahusiensis]|uniref:Phosphoenolpyruvate protein kinase n=1 Tax=Rhodopirellula bahusiensis TaxID=2014065 RepID=A0A2G1W4J3_9BACT|nr:phosphoenolpyruvate protein kinase [Rhodopirellula bahusiensis]